MSSTDPERWQAVKDLFDAALARPAEERARFLDRACADDQVLRKEVESLLASDEEAESFMETPAVAGAAESLIKLKARLSVGQKISHYQIASAIGAGGMGEVYLAKDTNLGRNVALKLLPENFAVDADRSRRFKQEAQTASALNHPNIITIYEIGVHEHTHFIAMEFIDGVTMRQKLASGPLPLADALDVAYQVAMALTAAHEAKIIHRDIKPENIMLRRDRLVKVLDFGLAKLTETTPPSLDSATPTKVLTTEPGRVMGTLSYMPPEQVRGLEVDARTDIWSLGVVLYEMVTGRAPFTGETTSHIAVAVLENDPAPLALIAPHAPSELQRIIRKSLAKDRDERYQSARDLLIDLKNLKQDLPSTVSHRVETEAKAVPQEDNEGTSEIHTAITTPDGRLPSRKVVFWGAGVTALLLTATVAAYWYSIRPKPSTPLHPLTAIPLTTDLGFEGLPSLSPDGSQVAYASGGPESDHFDIYVKQIGGGPARRLTSDPATDEFPAWSPDGRSIAFIRDRNDKLEVLLIPSSGGPERKIAEIAPDTSTGIFNWTPPYLSWTRDSAYLVAPDFASPGEALSLFLFSVTTGERRKLTTPPPTTLGDGNPAVSPDGRTLAFARILTPGHAQLHLLPLSGDYQPAGEPRRLDLPQPLAKSPVWTADGRDILCDAGAPWGGGTLWRVAVSGSEKPQPLGSIEEGACCATISWQGKRIVYARWTWDLDIWRTEISHKGKTGPAVKLIASTRGEFLPQYSPDGSKIVFASNRSGVTEIWICNGDGSNPVQLTSTESNPSSPRWFPDGRRIVFDSVKEGTIEIYVMEIATLVPRRLTNGQADNGQPSVSHDGKWIYFGSRRTGNWEIWRMPAEGGEAVQVTHHGGEWPSESLDGRVVYYLKGRDVWQVPVAGGEETRVLGPIDGYTFAVTKEGIYFLETGPRLWLGSRENALKIFRLATRTSEKIADIGPRPDDGLSVSPDGRYAIIPMVDPFVCDLMLVENFR